MRCRWPVLVVAAAIALGGSGVAVGLDGERETANPEAALQVAPRDRAKLTPWRLFPEAGQFRLDAFVFGSLESESDFVTLGPDLWYGIRDGIALGVVHSGYGSYGFFGLPSGICLSDCGEDVYGNVGARGLFRLREGDFALAADTGVVIDLVNETQVALRAGVAAQMRRSFFRLELNPALLVALNQRDIGTNELALVPITAGFIVTPELRLDVQTGYIGELAELDNAWILPITVGGAYDWTEHLSLGLRVSYFRTSDDQDTSALEFFVSLRH